MKSIQYRKRNDLSGSIGQGETSPRGDALTDPLMRTTGVEILLCVASQHVSQMVFTEDDDVIQTFPSYSSKKSFADGIHCTFGAPSLTLGP
jgi:hypothetical protein